MKSKFKKVVLLSILLLIVIIVGGIFVYATTDFFKKPDQLFKKYLLDGVIQISKFNIEPYGSAFERMKSEPVEIQVKMEKEFENTDYYLGYNENVQKYSLSATETLKMDLKNKNIAYLIDVKNDDKDYLKFNILKTNETYGIYVPEIHEKYIALENRDIKKLAETFGAEQEIIDIIPNSIPTSSFTEEENNKLKEIAFKYIIKIFEQIDMNLYTKEKYATQDFEGEEIKGNKYILTISEDALQEIITNVSEEVKQDEELKNLFEGKAIGAVIDFYKSAIEIVTSSLGTINEMPQYEDELLEEPTNTNDVQYLKICIYESDKKTTKFEIVSADENITEFSIKNKENSSNIFIKISESRTEYNEVGTETKLQLTNKYENNNGEFKLQINEFFNKEDIELLKQENANSVFSDWYDDEYYAEMYEDTELIFKMTSNKDNDLISSTITYNNIDSEENSIEEIDLTIKFDSNIEVPKLTDSNKIVVNDYSIEDFTNLGNQIIENMNKSANENPETMIGSLVKQEEQERLEDIAYYREYVAEEVRESIEYNLEEYKEDLQYDETVNPSDYLTLDKIKENLGFRIDEVELIDGTTLKCLVEEEYTYFVKISIDGVEWKLIDLTVLYSEDGTLENAV